jgi:hypothetical protein
VKIAGYMIDGKPVLNWLFSYRKKDMRGDMQEFFVQVEAFSLDHAFKRMLETYPVPRADIVMVCDLDPEHDIGMIGTKLPLVPAGTTSAPGSSRLQ